MRANPLSYGVAALSQSFLVQGHPLQTGLASRTLCLEVTLVFGAFTFLMCVISTLKKS